MANVFVYGGVAIAAGAQYKTSIYKQIQSESAAFFKYGGRSKTRFKNKFQTQFKTEVKLSIDLKPNFCVHIKLSLKLVFKSVFWTHRHILKKFLKSLKL